MDYAHNLTSYLIIESTEKKNTVILFSKVLARSEDIFRRNAERRRKSAQAEALSRQAQALPAAPASETTTTTTEWTGSTSRTEEATLATTPQALSGTLEIRPNTAPPTPGVRQRHIRKVREGHPSRRSGNGGSGGGGSGGGGGGSSATASCSDRNGPRKRLLAYIRHINPPPTPAANERIPTGTACGDFVGVEGKGTATTGAPSGTAEGEDGGGEGEAVVVTGVAGMATASAAAVAMGDGTERTGCGTKIAAMRAARWRRREKEEEDARIQAREQTTYFLFCPSKTNPTTSDKKRSSVNHPGPCSCRCEMFV